MTSTIFFGQNNHRIAYCILPYLVATVEKYQIVISFIGHIGRDNTKRMEPNQISRWTFGMADNDKKTIISWYLMKTDPRTVPDIRLLSMP